MGEAASFPPLNLLPLWPDFNGIRLRNPHTFRCGNLHQFANQWDSFMTGIKGYDVVKPWIHRGVHVPDFFEHYEGYTMGVFSTRLLLLCIFKTIMSVARSLLILSVRRF